MYLKKNLGQLIAYRRNDLGLTQTDLGNLANLSRSHIARIENGGSAPPLETLLKLNEVLKINLIDNKIIHREVEGISLAEYRQFVIDQAKKKDLLDESLSLPGGKTLLMVDLVEPYVEDNFLKDYTSNYGVNPDFPKHFIVLDKEYKGVFLAWRVRGDGMNDGTIHSIPKNSIVTVQRIKKSQWKSKADPYRWKVFLVLLKDRIVLCAAGDVDVAKGTMVMQFLNPDKVDYPDVVVSAEDVLDIYNVVTVTIGE